MRPALLLLPALLTLTGTAHADHQQGNLRPLTAADLCPPTSYVYLDDQEQEDLELKVDEQLIRYATLYAVPFGDPKTCTVAQLYNVDAFRAEDGRVLYSLSFSLELLKDARITLGTRTLTASHLQLWSTAAYGSLPGVSALASAAAENARTSYEDFALAWKATHGR
ncbi:hypothetical protein DEIPH_ctg044orf0083 [Deinococcus phoenicis]|uniref:Lipoprotein n=1 Tax=Deinococcus phoenicis TaxID=1476583 RepID=A0A016QNJ5_9DEIO|nr:hypothetical protein [Deinococcus phoenicis]EYB67354.1 hypothetical protein DEIPH_ctg044orf0083 [Deinococcus phoenicis]